MLEQILKGIGRILIMIKKILTLKVVFENILSSQKYTKKTNVPKENISILGISKL